MSRRQRATAKSRTVRQQAFRRRNRVISLLVTTGSPTAMARELKDIQYSHTNTNKDKQ